jgi:hypothetical protein
VPVSTETPEELPAPLVAGLRLLAFVDGDTFVLDTLFNQILHGTFMRSRETFAGTCVLLSEGLPVQAAMLVRSLFEDMVVAHWVVLHHKDPSGTMS